MKPTVLVAEDDTGCATICAEVLEKHGFVVFVAHDGVRALRLAAERLPDIVLTDLYLPVMDGGELIRRLRDGGIQMPIVLMSGSPDGAVQAFRHRADAYLAKPFPALAALEVIERILARATSATPA